jgi:hypothetical protein
MIGHPQGACGAAGLAEDIEFAASLDRFRNVVGYFAGGKVRRLEGSGKPA